MILDEEEKIPRDRYMLINELIVKFSNDFKRSMEAFSDAEQVEVSGSLMKIAKRFQEKENYDDIYEKDIEPILLKYKSKCRELANCNLTDYFGQGSLKLFDLMHNKKIDDPARHLMEDKEYKLFMSGAKRCMSNHRYFTILRLPPDDQFALKNANELDGIEDTISENTEFTTRRRALFLHYLNYQFKFSQDKKPLAEIAHFLTGNNQDNLYKHLLNPLKVKNEDSKKGEEALRKDLIYVRGKFERLGLKKIIESIDMDLQSFD